MMLQLGAPAGAASPGAAAVRTTDGAILGAIGARDANLIEAATLARTKAQSAAVKSFAGDVLRDHQRSLTRGAALATQLQVTRLLPADSAMVRTQRAQMVLLDSLSGAAFDRAFVQFVVDDHAAAILKVTRTQLPQARHADVVALVRSRLPGLREHQVMGQAWLAANP
jgi:putative membrane protein